MLVIDVYPRASARIASRKDYDEMVHKYSFTVSTPTRTLDLIAPNEDAYRYATSMCTQPTVQALGGWSAVPADISRAAA